MNNFPILEEEIGDGKRRCLLCPHFCILRVSQFGACKVRFNSSEKISTCNYGMLTNVSIEPLKKKPILHYGSPDDKTLSIGSWGCNLKCRYCLPPETLISTLNGLKRIDQIEDGEEIFALDNSNNDPQLVLAHVGHVFDREAEEVIVIEVDGGSLELTPEHPVMTKNRGWVEAKDLTYDDEILCDKTCL